MRIAALAGLVLGLVLGSAVSLAGCSAAPAAGDRPGAQAADTRRPFFWRIEPADRTAKPSYILGTFHIGVEPQDVLTPAVWEALDSARAVVLEVNIATNDSLGLGMHKPGGSLKQQMSQAQWTELLGLLKLAETEAGELSQVKLWALYTTVLQELAPETESIDTELQNRAAGKTLVFLEQVGFQEKLFDKYINAEMMLALLRDKDGQRAKLASQAQAYKSGDVQRMYRESVSPESFEGSPPEFRDEILIDRNRRWMPVLAREVRAGGAFIAVGASHLLGEGGLLDLLSKSGYRTIRAK